MLKSWAPTLEERHFSPGAEHAAKIARSWMGKAYGMGLSGFEHRYIQCKSHSFRNLQIPSDKEDYA